MIGFALLIASFAAFALSTDGHHRQRLGRAPSAARRRSLKRAAWLLLVASMPFPVAQAGWIYGPILWTGLTMSAAGTVFFAVNVLFAEPSHRRGG